MAVFEDTSMSKSSGVAKAGLITGIIGSALGLGNMAGNPLFGMGYPNMYTGYNPYATPCNPNGNVVCGGDRLVDRHDMEQNHEIMKLQAALDSEKLARQSDANDMKLYEHFTNELKAVHAQLSEQRIENVRVSDSFKVVMDKIADEKRERCAADNTLVNYMNCTFYPKQIVGCTPDPADITPQPTHNPLPCDHCGCR